MISCDFIFGSRYEKNSGSEDDTIVTKIGNLYFHISWKRFFLDLNITDVLYTLMFLGRTTESAKKLKLKQKDFTFCAELPIKAKSRQKMKLRTTINCYERCKNRWEKKK